MHRCHDYKITPILRIIIMRRESFHIIIVIISNKLIKIVFIVFIVMAAVVEGGSNIELANRIIDNNLHQNTKRQYSNKVKHLYDWFKEFHPELCVPPDNVELELNLVATT